MSEPQHHLDRFGDTDLGCLIGLACILFAFFAGISLVIWAV